MDFSFFITNNKSGHKTREKWFSKNHKSEYDKIISYCEKFNLQTFKEKIWFYYHKLTNVPICVCGKKSNFSGRFDRGYNEFCNIMCVNTNKKIMVDRIKESNQNKWGVDFYPQHKDFINKVKETKKNRYGDTNYNNKDKMVNTKLLKYGNGGYNNFKKYKETCLNKYGVDNASKSDIVINKIKETNQKTYGYNSPTQSPQIKEKLKTTLLNNIKKRFNNNEFVNYNFELSEYKLNCLDCNEEYKIPMGLYNERKRLEYQSCTKCNPIGISKTSKYETEIIDFLKSIYKGEIIQSERGVIKQELDIYLPEFKLGIEFNGLYWHCELFKDSKYHLNKTNLCNNAGIDLIHIFEDEWLFNKEIVKSILKNKLNLIDNRLYGRKCIIKEIDNKTSTDFLNENHIQGGKSKNSVRVGLFHCDELVSVMTFSKGRIAVGGKNNVWEMVRFCNKINTTVIGSGSKLLKYFINNNAPEKIISYSDIRLFNGELYEKLGFKYIHKSQVNYWYVIENKRYHRFSYRKNVLVDQGHDKYKTEKEIMFSRKIYRIYDCGNVLWEWKIE